MSHEFYVKVIQVVSDTAVRVWREPDGECREGRAYGLPLQRVVGYHPGGTSVREGTVLRVHVEQAHPNRIARAELETAASGKAKAKQASFI